jgi:hypothetical protein
MEPLIFYFSNSKGACSLSFKNWFHRLKPKYVACEDTWGSLCKELIAGSPFVFMDDNFPTGNWFINL